MYVEPRIPSAFADYLSGGDSKSSKKKGKKKGAATERDPITGLPIGRVPEMEDEKDFMWLGNPYGIPTGTTSPAGYGGASSTTPMPNYGPSAMSGPPMPMSNYNPAQQMGQSFSKMFQPSYGRGSMEQINVQYTSADGTMYNIGVVAPQQKRGPALYNVLSGLYGLMMSEGQSGKYGKDGPGGKAYAGAKGGYSGGKGGKG